MRPEALSEAMGWMHRAERDLRIASSVLSGPERFADAAAFHAQQAAEKALKAFLTAQDRPFPRTHDLERLLGLCLDIEAAFLRFEHAARTLTPYVVEFRYPSGPLEPDLSEAMEAIDLATEMVDFVRQTLSAPST